MMIAKLFRDGTVLATRKTVRNRVRKFGIFLDWTMMTKIAGTGFDHEEIAEPPFREDG